MNPLIFSVMNFCYFVEDKPGPKKLTKAFCNCKMCIPNLQSKMSYSSLKNCHYCKSKKIKIEEKKSE